MQTALISLFGSPVELVPDQFFISIPLFSYPYPSMFTGTMFVSADPSSPLNVFNGDTAQVTFVASTSIPEPPTFLLFACAFGFLALLRASASNWLRPSWG